MHDKRQQFRGIRQAWIAHGLSPRAATVAARLGVRTMGELRNLDLVEIAGATRSLGKHTLESIRRIIGQVSE